MGGREGAGVDGLIERLQGLGGCVNVGGVSDGRGSGRSLGSNGSGDESGSDGFVGKDDVVNVRWVGQLNGDFIGDRRVRGERDRGACRDGDYRGEGVDRADEVAHFDGVDVWGKWCVRVKVNGYEGRRACGDEVGARSVEPCDGEWGVGVGGRVVEGWVDGVEEFVGGAGVLEGDMAVACV